MRAPISWICSSARQSQFWLPTNTLASSTIMYLACSTPPVRVSTGSTRTVTPGTLRSQATLSGFLARKVWSTSRCTATPARARAASASSTGVRPVPGFSEM